MLSIFQFDYILIFLQSITDDISEEHITMIFEGLDTSGDKKVDFEEFKVTKAKSFFYT